MGKITVGHISDSHLAYTAYPEARNDRGMVQRAVDVVKGFNTGVSEILAREPDLVLHTGDVFHIPQPTSEYLVQAGVEFRRIVATGVPLVVMSGNHDVGRDLNRPCVLRVFDGIPGVHVVTARYAKIDLSDDVDSGLAPESCRDVVVHAIPWESMFSIDWDSVIPVPGKTNILMGHAVVSGSAQADRSGGKEISIPTEVADRGWDYVALGHWHKQDPVFLPGHADDSTSKVWYAGSTENIGWSDVHHGGVEKGVLMVDVERGEEPSITRVDVPVRNMLQLPVVDALGLNPDEIAEALRERAMDAGGAAFGACARQKVINVNPGLWSLVNRSEAKSAIMDAGALTYEAIPDFFRIDVEDRSDDEGGGSDSDMEENVDSLIDTEALRLPEGVREGASSVAKGIVRDMEKKQAES